MENRAPNMPLKIGQVARRLDIAVETIRMYEREGLLIPRKSGTGQRSFDEADLHWIGCIRQLIQEQRLNLAGIRRLLSLVPCWDMRPCGPAEQERCPAYQDSTSPCWVIKSELPGECQEADCRECIVYRSACECANLKPLFRRVMQSEESTATIDT